MDNQEKFKKTSLPEKDNFHSHLNMKDITDAGEWMNSNKKSVSWNDQLDLKV